MTATLPHPSSDTIILIIHTSLRHNENHRYHFMPDACMHGERRGTV